MFIGSLVLFLSAIFIIVSTSLPVMNLFKKDKLTTGDDPAFAYNRVEIFIAVLLGLFTAVTQFLKYKQTAKDYLIKKIAIPTVVALVIAILVSTFGGINYDRYGAGYMVAIHLAMFAAIYAVVANAVYIYSGMRGKLKAAGASIAHVGFGLMLVGILLSSAKKEVLSHNTTGIMLTFDPGAKENPTENITLLKGVRTDMGKYWTTFIDGDSVDPRSKAQYFHVRFEKKDGTRNFDLYPHWLKSNKGQQQISANPDKYHYWDRDIFSYITASDNPEQRRDDTVQFKSNPIAVHDTVFFSKGLIILDSIVVNPEKYHFGAGDTALMAKLTVIGKDSMRYTATPVYYVKDNQPQFIYDTVFAQNLALRFNGLAQGRKIDLGVKESAAMIPFVALKVYEFPQINILWIGTIIMIIGFIMSIVWRRRQAKALI
jgi:cytochrome c-type biogenesis protein CcmF